MNENKRNKPIALAITLVILVLCLMLNIVFISKNIDYKQQLQVKTGKAIVNLLEEVKNQSYYIEEHVLNKGQVTEQANNGALQNANVMLLHELTRLERMISNLFEITTPISPVELSPAAINGEVPKLATLIAKLEGDAIVDEYTHEQLATVLDDIQASTEMFNYKLKGVKTAMIRMSNGFEWPESIQALDKAIKND